jgi:hypothetical protein
LAGADFSVLSGGVQGRFYSVAAVEGLVSSAGVLSVEEEEAVVSPYVVVTSVALSGTVQADKSPAAARTKSLDQGNFIETKP